MGKRLTAHQRKVKNLKNILKGASKRLKSMLQIENALAKAKRLATSYLDYSALTSQITEAENYLNSDKKITSNIDRMVRNIGANTSTSSLQSMVKMSYYETKQRGNNRVATDAEISIAKVTRLKKRYDKDKSTTTKKEYDIITRYHAAINPVSNASAMQYTPQELAAMRNRKKAMKARDTSFGGDSTLINDLAYSADVEYAREFIETLMSVMNDPFMFEQIETWYRSNTDLQRLLDGARGSYWYEDYCEARNAIIAFIDELKSNFDKQLSSDTKEKLENLKDIMDNQDDTYNN